MTTIVDEKLQINQICFKPCRIYPVTCWRCTSFSAAIKERYFVDDRLKQSPDKEVEQQTADAGTAGMSSSCVFAEMRPLTRKTKALEKHIHL